MDRKEYAKEWHRQYRLTNKEEYNRKVREGRAARREEYNAYNREYRAVNSVKMRASQKANREKHKDTLEYMVSRMLAEAKRRAKKQGIPFDIGVEDIFLPTHCPILGTLFTKPSKGSGRAADTSYSLDKTIPALGYVKGNVAIISCLANRLKNSNSIETLEAILVYLKSRT